MKAQSEHAPELSLPRELRLWQDTHVDDVATPRAVHLALRTSRELRALHADDAFVLVELRAGAVSSEDVRDALLEPVDEAIAERVAEGCMGDDGGAFEEASGAHALGAVYDLHREDEVTRGNLLAQRADGGEGEDGAHAEGLQGGDVSLSGHGGWVDGVAGAMAGKEGDLSAGW